MVSLDIAIDPFSFAGVAASLAVVGEIVGELSQRMVFNSYVVVVIMLPTLYACFFTVALRERQACCRQPCLLHRGAEASRTIESPLLIMVLMVGQGSSLVPATANLH